MNVDEQGLDVYNNLGLCVHCFSHDDAQLTFTFSRRQMDYIFFLFFQENKICHFMQIVSEMSIVFPGKNKKK